VRVDDRTGEPAEPFPWLSSEKKQGPFRSTPIRTPRSEAILGTFILGVAVAIVVILFRRGSAGEILLGVSMFCVMGGPAIFLLVAAFARARWARAIRRRRGYSPF
jgi:hypothetical protein